jgi:hypothetical protein
MNDSARVMRRPRRAGPRPARTVAAIIATAVLALLAAACGGGRSSSAAGGSAQHDRAVAFARCMRSHGVSDWPDPDSRGGFPGVSKQMLSSPTGQSALHACRHLMPNSGGGSGGQPSQTQQQQLVSGALHFAVCMRSHGEPDWPDPTGGDLKTVLMPFGGHTSGIDIHSAEFRSAYQACESKLPRQIRPSLPGGGS